ncbi:polar amino acid ABC transporter inner membrane subunit [Liquorilactobacillus aquaticus DSM 21051]|uniref:Polar amino acid ABC transporter inner membrane subunit n=1 Tax=Liquorilactobacillus aquaticus DSM 21051 TaxID=1423725 RepID=A0A0R2D744_9LACO|nr:amino acid ABC transporter permease [Liquorilactobacillus aquaticus]KRM96092.1 polar amino acid ABC transporter inner membrane subunit [Liquorilactobacillus aquaticus DSM 21051]
MDLKWSEAIDGLGPSLLQGVVVVLQATIISFILAALVGLLIAMCRLSKWKVIRGVFVVFVEIIRGTPLLVQLFYIYYVVPLLLNHLLASGGTQPNIQFTALSAGIAGMTINYGAYISEVFRSAILSIDTGQKESGLALGFTQLQVLRKIVIPQALRNSIPVLGNYLVMMIKDTSLLAVISVSELLLRTQTYASQTFQTIESYTILAVVYLILSLPLAHIMKMIEKKFHVEN